MTLASIISQAYKASGITRTCARALDGEAPDQPGDDSATAATLEIVRGMFDETIDGLEVIERDNPSLDTRNTPVLKLFRRHQEISALSTAHAITHPSASDDEIDRLFNDEMFRLNDEMMALPCQTPADFAAKSIVSTCNGGLGCDWDNDPLWQEARSLIAATDDMKTQRHEMPTGGGPVGLVAEWRVLSGKWKAAATALAPKDAEGPEIEAISREVAAMCLRIEVSTPTTQADCAALIQWVLEDGGGVGLDPMHTTVQRKVADFLTGAA